jgi:hypothetical protein
LRSLFPEQPAETFMAMIIAVMSLHPDHLLDDDGHLGAFVREVARISR